MEDLSFRLIYDFMKENYRKYGDMEYLDNWIQSREGDIIAVFIEYLEVFRKQNYTTDLEEQLIEDYRCLSKKSQKNVREFLYKIYDKECQIRVSQQIKENTN